VTGYSEPITFRDTKDVVRILARIAEKEGQQVGTYARMLVRRGLRDRDDLTEAERKVLGVAAPAEVKRPLGFMVEQTSSMKH